MADIDSIISGVAGNTRYDFSTFGDPVKSYFDAKDQKAKNDLRDAFKEGLPMKGDQPDWGAVSKTFFQKGAIEQGLAAANQGLAQQKQEYGQRMGETAFPSAGQPQQPLVSPTTSRNSVTPDPGKRMDASTSQAAPSAPQGQPGKPPATVMTVLAAQGIPNSELERASASIARQLGVDPTAPLDMNDPQVRNVLAPAVAQLKRMGIGQIAQNPNAPPQIIPPVGQAGPQAPPVMAQAQPQAGMPQPAPAQPPPDFNSRFSAARPGQGSDPTLGGLVPPGRTAQQQIDGLSRAVASGMLSPEQAKAYQSRIEAITKAIEPTGPMKEYDKAVQQGFKGTLEDWQNRTDENTTQRDILTKSIIPRLEKSQEKASAARDDIDILHRAKAELDRPGGIFSGALAGKKLELAKAAELFGISSDKIANTEAFSAAAGQRVASLIKAFGSGSAISDGDRKFTEGIAAGRITLDERSIRRLFDIGEQAGRLVIDRHNGLADSAIKANEGLKAARGTLVVDQPGQYKKAAAPDPYTKAREAIAAGAPRDAVAARLKQSGFDPGKL